MIKTTGGGAGGAVDSAPYSNLKAGSNALGSEWSAAYRHQNIEEKEQHQQYAVYATLLALEWVEDSRISKVIICSESLSALLCIGKGNTSNHQQILYELPFAHHRLCEKVKIL